MLEERLIDCPFCGQGKIKISYRHKVIIQKGRGFTGKGHALSTSKERFIVLSEKCSNCGKSDKEIERCLKEGKTPDREALLKRIKDQGLPTRI